MFPDEPLVMHNWLSTMGTALVGGNTISGSVGAGVPMTAPARRPAPGSSGA